MQFIETHTVIWLIGMAGFSLYAVWSHIQRMKKMAEMADKGGKVPVSYALKDVWRTIFVTLIGMIFIFLFVASLILNFINY